MASRSEGYGKEKTSAAWGGGPLSGSISIVGLESCDKLRGKGGIEEVPAGENPGSAKVFS